MISYRNFIKIFFVSLVFDTAHATNKLPEFIIRPQTQDEAYICVERIIDRLPFYEKMGYHATLPTLPEFEALRHREKPISVEEKAQLRTVFYANLYDLSAFDASMTQLKQSEEIIKKACEKLLVLKNNWGFKLFDTYTIFLTLYGPGGRYFTQNNTIELVVNAYSATRYREAYQSAIHEMIHLGIEELLVQKYKLSHWEKERLVDLICSTYLKDLLPKYFMQKQGDRKIDAFVNEETIVHDLPSAIARFVVQYPRA